MSLIIATVTPSGIIAAADTRTTIKRDKDTTYFDETQKVFGVYGRVAILTCGDNMVTPNITVQSLIGKYIKEKVEPGKISIKTIASFTYSAIGIMISWLLGIVLNIASIAMLLITKYKLSRVFGHDVDYFIGLIFLPLIFYLILGFGSSTYTCPPNHSRLKG